MILLAALVLITITAWTLAGVFAIDALHDTDNPYECDCCDATFPTVARFAAHICDREIAAEGVVVVCEPGTGWFYCGWRAADGLLVCRCDCTCLDQAHCALTVAPSDAEGTFLPVPPPAASDRGAAGSSRLLGGSTFT